LDTSVNYMGLRLPHPFIAGSSPLGDTIDSAKRIEDGGASAIVLRSLFEEQIGSESVAAYLATMGDNYWLSQEVPLGGPGGIAMAPEDYLEHIRHLKQALEIPVIASLNGSTLGGWLSYAKAVAEVGADAIELNVYSVPMNEDRSAEDIEKETIEMVSEVSRAVAIPVSIKISPFYTSLPHFARRLEEAGARGVVLFNRFFDIDVDNENLEVVSRMHLSQSQELLMRLRWIAILSALLKKADIAATGGVHGTSDAVKAILCGASCIQLVSGVIRRGPAIFKVMKGDLETWMEQHEYGAIDHIRGKMNLLRSTNPNEFARANYLRQLQSWQPES
jgi:dihydroorotate dehydrogenase (fumarate)